MRGCDVFICSFNTLYFVLQSVDCILENVLETLRKVSLNHNECDVTKHDNREQLTNINGNKENQSFCHITLGYISSAYKCKVLDICRFV